MSDEEYIVEKIVGKRTKGDTIEYQLKWEGYSEKENTWEPYKKIRHLAYMIEEFEKEQILRNNTVKKCNTKFESDKNAAVNGILLFIKLLIMR
jgi:hypothetical protein